MHGILNTADMRPETVAAAGLAPARHDRHSRPGVRAMDRMMEVRIAGGAMEPDEAARLILDAEAQGRLGVLPAHERPRRAETANAVGA